DFRDQLISNGIAVWSKVRGINRVGVVVIRVRMLDLDDEKVGKVWPGPIFVELVSLLLNDAVVTREFETLVVVGLEIWIRGLLAKTAQVSGKMAVKNHERILRFGV